MKVLNGQQIKKILISGANNLANYKAEIDSLNVFPVPDGDTGTNMTLSISSGADAISKLESDKVNEVLKAFSKGLLMGARGNSGVILSQIFRGLARGLENNEEVTAYEFAKALIDARDVAYKAVMKPVEGTILTVIRETADKVAKDTKKDADFFTVFEAIVKQSHESLKRTPDLLPVLKEVGVVDSGGAGLVKVFEGMQSALLGNEIARQEVQSGSETKASAQMSVEHEEFGYCTEFILQLDPVRVKKNKFSEDKLTHQLANIGNSIVVVQDEEIVKVHVHTLTPGVALNIGQQYGEFLKLKSENMSLQHEEIINHQPAAVNTPKKQYGIIAVCAGEGIKQLFLDYNVDYVIEGGQTMNPSTEDFTSAISKINAENIIILPNNSNIIMAAQQAASIVTDSNVVVIPSKTIPQGIVATMMFSDNSSIEDNVESMTNCLSEVKTGQVTYAVRDTQMDNVEIKAGDFMGIAEKQIIISTKDKIEATTVLIDNLVDDVSEILTLIVGEDTNEEEVCAITTYIEEKYDEIEVEVVEGKQPVYSFIIGVE